MPLTTADDASLGSVHSMSNDVPPTNVHSTTVSDDNDERRPESGTSESARLTARNGWEKHAPRTLRYNVGLAGAETGATASGATVPRSPRERRGAQTRWRRFERGEGGVPTRTPLRRSARSQPALRSKKAGGTRRRPMRITASAIDVMGS
ncbi:hypothetical protein MTO96_006691 [Rhipicephalus appendiculatus]